MLAPPFAIFAAALLHEDLALLAAGFFVIEQGFSPPIALALIVGGVVLHSLVLYGVGRVTRGHRWVRRWLGDDRLRTIGARMERRLFTTLLLTRIGQGLGTPTLIGCGWLRVPLARLLPLVALTALLYHVPLLAAVIAFGPAAVDWIAQVGWAPLLAVACVAALLAWRARAAA
jgi:membrane protein DedA with SNARE-associated domain